MKTFLAVLALGFALSTCHLTSKVRNTSTTGNVNGDSTSSSTPNELQSPPPAPGVDQKSSAKKITAPISGGVLNGKATSMPLPVYPPIAKAAHASGTVTVQVVVNEDGQVISAHPVSGHPLLQAAAVTAARAARFVPMKLSGQPVKVTGMLIYNFKAE